MGLFRSIVIIAGVVAVAGAVPNSLLAKNADGMLAPCKDTAPQSTAETPSQRRALSLLGSVTQLESRFGRPVLASNLATTVAINNQASPASRAQALVDTLITDANANILADGLGSTMADIYRRKAVFQSDDDGATTRCGAISPAVSALISAANGISSGDSSAGKFGFANGVGGRYMPPAGGVLDVLGKAYGRPAGSPGADKHGNSRPFQTAPIGATSGPRIETYQGRDFFGVATDSRLMLTGATPQESAAGLTGSDLKNNPAFPSGHTTFGYTESLLLALMVPERFQALAYRGSEYGDSRIVVGAHYALDVIAGRTLATYDLAQNLAGRPHYAEVDGHAFQAGLAAAAADLRAYLQQNGCPSIAACAARDPILRAENAAIMRDGRRETASPRAAYAFRLTYSLWPMGPTDRAPEPVPEEAGYLLQSRFPYLTPAQRREVLRTTEGPSGHFLDVSPLDGMPLSRDGKGAEAQAGVYSRLDLFAAAGGYASLQDQVVVDQDRASIADQNLRLFGGLAEADTWSNDIAGPGGLTKRGSGTLTLSGTNTYTGPTLVQHGTLEVAGSIRSALKVEGSGTLAGAGKVGDVTVGSGGTFAPGALVDGGPAGGLRVAGALTFGDGSAFRAESSTGEAALVTVDGAAALGNADLVVTPREPPRPGARVTLLTATGGVRGAFRRVAIQRSSLVPKLTYAADAVYLVFEERSASRTDAR